MQSKRPVRKREPLTQFFQREIQHNITESAKVGAQTRELAWAKRFGEKPYSRTQRMDKAAEKNWGHPINSILIALEERAGNLVVLKPTKDPLATTNIHTHPCGSGAFSKYDMEGFLAQVPKNKRLRFNVIVAHNQTGKEIGRTILYYSGSKVNAKKLLVLFKKDWRKKTTDRWNEIKKHPELFRDLQVGDCLIRPHEQRQFVLDFLKKHKMRLRHIPAKGYFYYQPSDKYIPVR